MRKLKSAALTINHLTANVIKFCISMVALGIGVYLFVIFLNRLDVFFTHLFNMSK